MLTTLHYHGITLTVIIGKKNTTLANRTKNQIVSVAHVKNESKH